MSKHTHSEKESQPIQQDLVMKLIPNFKDELISLQITFANQMNQHLSVKPMLIVFDPNNRKPLIAFTRDSHPDIQDDFYSSVSELLFIIPSMQPKVFMLAIDRNSNKYFDTEKVYPFTYQDSIVIFIVSDSVAIAAEVEYNFYDNKVQWTGNINYFQIVDIKDIFVEMLFVYSHIDEPPIKYTEVLQYLASNGVLPMIVDEQADPNTVFILKKGVYTT